MLAVDTADDILSCAECLCMHRICTTLYTIHCICTVYSVEEWHAYSTGYSAGSAVQAWQPEIPESERRRYTTDPAGSAVEAWQPGICGWRYLRRVYIHARAREGVAVVVYLSQKHHPNVVPRGSIARGSVSGYLCDVL